MLIALLALISDKFKDKKIDYNIIGLYILIIAIILGHQEISKLNGKQHKLETKRGEIYTTKAFHDATDMLIKYIDKNTKKTDKIVILPEGMFINFLTDRPTDNFYNSLIPLYVETFGEEKIINHFKKNKPEYIVFNNWNNQDYGFNYICSDYAVSFCNFVATDYTQEKVINEGFRYLIFKLK